MGSKAIPTGEGPGQHCYMPNREGKGRVGNKAIPSWEGKGRMGNKTIPS